MRPARRDGCETFLMGMGLLLGTMAALAVVWLLWRLRHGRPLANRGRKRTRTEVAPIDLAAAAGARRCRPKPKWVAGAVIRLCALMPHDGCRKIAATFNRAHAHRGETVGKSYVASLTKRRALAILTLRRKLKNRATHPGPRNLTWAADLTFLPDRPQPALGVIDHGTRALIALRDLRVRTTVAILRVILDSVERFGRPRYLRRDNEAIFASRWFTVGLALVGIRHQRIDRFCPWQNGRIERVFGTLKSRLLRWWEAAGVPDDVQADLDLLRVWYNHVRPHQGLRGQVPAEVWDPGRRGALRVFDAWGGLLSGYGRST